MQHVIMNLLASINFIFPYFKLFLHCILEFSSYGIFFQLLFKFLLIVSAQE